MKAIEVVSKSGKKTHRFEMSEAEFRELDDANEGLCCACGETSGGCEPDMRKGICESCDEPRVYGAQELLIMGNIHFTGGEEENPPKDVKRLIESSGEEGGKSICSCGHLGDGPRSDHRDAACGLAEGHGACHLCPCPQFTWVGFKPGLDIKEMMRRRQARGNPPEWRCEGCGASASSPLDYDYPVCMDCTRARHRGAVTHRCSCGRLRKPKTITHLGRTWRSCERCLAPIAGTQKNPPASRYTFRRIA